jgi:hypothetical protein
MFIIVIINFDATGVWTCKADILLEPHLQSILLQPFLEVESLELFPWANLESWSSQSHPPK